MGEAAGVCCLRLHPPEKIARTLAKSGGVDELRKLLHRANHKCSINSFQDLDDLIPSSEVIASSSLDGFSTGKGAIKLSPTPTRESFNSR